MTFSVFWISSPLPSISCCFLTILFEISITALQHELNSFNFLSVAPAFSIMYESLISAKFHSKTLLSTDLSTTASTSEVSFMNFSTARAKSLNRTVTPLSPQEPMDCITAANHLSLNKPNESFTVCDSMLKFSVSLSSRVLFILPSLSILSHLWRSSSICSLHCCTSFSFSSLCCL